MGRLASAIKGQFYPSPPTVIDEIAKRIQPCIGATGFDPCAGQGMAILQLCDLLDAEAWACELSEDRARVLTALLDDRAMLADFTRTHVSPNGFSFALTNPPFADETGGGRSEVEFLCRTTPLLVDGGLMIFIAPEDVARSRAARDHFTEYYTNVSAMPFPADVRRYEEVVLMGTRRRHVQPAEYTNLSWLDRMFDRQYNYQLLPGRRPRVFRAIEPTDTELTRLVAASPLRFMIDQQSGLDDDGERPRPPMSISAGHRALLLASGYCDGLIEPTDEPPHLVRGSCGKETYVASVTTEEDESGDNTTKTTLSEKPILCLRVLESNGKITTLQ